MPRPRKQSDERKSAVISLRLSPREYDSLKSVAARTGHSIGDVARRKLLDDNIVVRTSRRLPVEAYAELRKIGVNLNQMARRMNASPRVDQTDVHVVRTQIDRLMDLLGDHHESGLR